ncbi:DNA-binding response regulator [Streptomyces sp. NPDC057137]|uniref:response regulator transcription factor n=1 Tax=Streptomyces sp. NPDC057137 TaxID=3346030 RepID=UPI00362C4FE9
MHRVLLTGGPTLVRDAYAHIIGASAVLTLQGQTATLPDALAQLPAVRPDLLLIDAGALPNSPTAATQLVLRQAAAGTRLAVIGSVPPSDIAFFVRAGVTGILGRDIDVPHFVAALDLVSGGGLVISSLDALLAAHNTRAVAPPSALEHLSDRERQVLALVASQRDNNALAQLLGLSPLTVKTHVNRILRKLGATSRAHLVAIAYESGLITPGTPGTPGTPLPLS